MRAERANGRPWPGTADDESMGSRTGQLFGVGVSFGGVLAIVEAAEAAAPALGVDGGRVLIFRQ
jgi:hypothetical protein